MKVSSNPPRGYLQLSGSSLVNDSRLQGRLVAENASDRACLDRIKGLLSYCETEHPKCRHAELAERPLPSRVLDLQSSEGIRLLESKQGQNGRYVALSHCWGDPLKMKTKLTTNTLSQMKNHISLESLSVVFRDAITVTRHLQVRYLWIDALCIIQDSKSDWETEAAQMSSIYENATLMIAASSSPGSSYSFLSPRPSPLVGEVPIQYTEPSTGLSSLLYVRPLLNNRKIMQAHMSEALQTRAWCLQERLLSQRAVYFDTWQFLWQCNTGCFPENSSEKVPKDLTIYVREFYDDHSMLPYASVRAIAGVEIEKHTTAVDSYRISYWDELLNNYGARRLTYGTDALTALAGVARCWSEVTGDRYLAGIWERYFHKELLWHFYDKQPRRPARCPGAPSWSWVSVWDPTIAGDAPVRMGQPNVTNLLDDKKAQLLMADMEPEGIDRFGPLKRAALHLRGWSRVVHLPFNLILETGVGDQQFLRFSEQESASIHFVGTIDGDADLRDRDQMVDNLSTDGNDLRFKAFVLCLERETLLRVVPYKIQGLLLIPNSQEEGTYLRRGIFTLEFLSNQGGTTEEVNSMWRRWDKQELTIV